MTSTEKVASQEAPERKLPKRAQFFTSWDDPMPGTGEYDGKLTGPVSESPGPSRDVQSVWYDFGTTESPGRVFIVKYGPTYVGRAHSHDTDYCSIVVEGSIEIARKVFGRGAIRFVKSETTYGPIIAGPEGATVIEFFPGPTGGISTGKDEEHVGPLWEPYDYFTPAARQAFLAPWVNGSAD